MDHCDPRIGCHNASSRQKAERCYDEVATAAEQNLLRSQHIGSVCLDAFDLALDSSVHQSTGNCYGQFGHHRTAGVLSLRL